jgi:DNA transposition AAA+ family ATPase
MHTNTLPPTDREDKDTVNAFETSAGVDQSDTLRTQVKATGLSHGEIAKGCGKSVTQVNQWLNHKYPGNVAGLEASLRAWLRDLSVTSATGVSTVETPVSKFVVSRLEEVRLSRELVLFVGEAGIGKSRSQDVYCRAHPLTIAFRVLPWHSGMAGLADDLCHATDIRRIPAGQRRWNVIVEKTKGSGRMLLVDDAHELGPRGLQCCVDYHEETGNPVALFGLPQLKARLMKDSRRARRIADVLEVKCTDTLPLVEHLVNELAHDAADERPEVIALCSKVAQGIGCFGSVEKQLKLAARERKKKLESARKNHPEYFRKDGLMKWVPALHAVHFRLLRNYSLN